MTENTPAEDDGHGSHSSAPKTQTQTQTPPPGELDNKTHLAVQLHLAQKLLGDPARMSPGLKESIQGLTPDQLLQALSVAAKLLKRKAEKKRMAAAENPRHLQD